MKRIGFGVLALPLLATVGVLVALCWPRAFTAAAHAQRAAQTGWLEGTITSTDGQVLRNHNNYNNNFGAYIRGTRQGGGTFEAYTDPRMGGLYSVRNLKPGIYEVFVPIAYNERLTKFRPQHLFGVVIRPGVRTVLNITTEPGEALEEVGKPAVATQSVVVISNELTRLQKQIDALKAR